MSNDPGSPLVPVYPFNEPNQPISLYAGPLGGLGAADVPGAVELSWTPGPSLDWSAGPVVSPEFANRAEVTLLLQRPDGQMQLPGLVRGIDVGPDGVLSGAGWSNGAVLGREDASLSRVIAHWFNLPDWHGPISVADTTADGSQRRWAGRWVIEAGGWTITVDVRPDHAQVWRDLHKAHTYVMTHIMELRRDDGTAFTAAEAQPVLTALHVGISFALGRWAAPMLPVGQDRDGNIAWENWAASHCDPAQHPSPGWWYAQDHESLAGLLRQMISVSSDPDTLSRLRLQMVLAIMAMSNQGFVEQRIMSGAAGLEHILWQTLVLGGRMTKNQFDGHNPYEDRDLAGHDRLRMVLEGARIPIDIDCSLLPVLAEYADQMKQLQGLHLDGADMVTWTRNRLVHPEGTQEPVYRLNGLVAEVSLLTRHYLALLILHSLGYHGNYRDLRKRQGWSGDIAKVPWALPAVE